VLLNALATPKGIRARPDAVLSGHVVTTPAAAAIAAARGVPFVNYLYAEEVPRRPRVSRYALRHGAGSVALSRHTKQVAIEHGADPATVRVVPPGIVTGARRERPRADRPTILTVARLEDRFKGHDVMVDVVDLLRRSIPDLQWVVVGDGSLRAEYEGLVRARSLEPYVRFVGEISDEERDRWFDEAHVFAMPNRIPEGGAGEGFGIVFAEASAHELPVVGGACAGTLDAVDDGRTGFLVDPTDVPAVADAIERLLRDPGLAQSLGRNGPGWAARFSWPGLSRQVEDLMLEVIAA
jgi:phosphatidylinositol alpha-1,6-mannosyltransferase